MLLVVYEKLSGRVQALFSGDQQIKLIYQDNPGALERLDGIYVEDGMLTRDNVVGNYKVLDGAILRMTDEEIESTRFKNPYQVKIEKLEQENAMLYSAIAELSMLLGGSL